MAQFAGADPRDGMVSLHPMLPFQILNVLNVCLIDMVDMAVRTDA